MWHRQLGHVNMEQISKLSKKDLIEGLLKVNSGKDGMCALCQRGKQTKISFKSKNHSSTS